MFRRDISGYPDREPEAGGPPPGSPFLAKPFTRASLIEQVRRAIRGEGGPGAP